MRSSTRYAAVSAAGVLVTLGLAGPAAAAPRSGGCPAPFTAVTQSELVLVLRDADPTLRPEEAASNAAGAFALVNRNGDPFLCYIPIGKRGFVNVIDNAVPHPRAR